MQLTHTQLLISLRTYIFVSKLHFGGGGGYKKVAMWTVGGSLKITTYPNKQTPIGTHLKLHQGKQLTLASLTVYESLVRLSLAE